MLVVLCVALFVLCVILLIFAVGLISCFVHCLIVVYSGLFLVL